MSAIDDTRTETLRAAVFARDSPVDAAEGLAAVLRAIDGHAHGLSPDIVLGRGTVPYSHEAVAKVINSQRSRSKIVVHILRSANPEVLYEMSFVKDEPINFWMRITVPFEYFSDPATTVPRVTNMLDLVQSLGNACNVEYGYAHTKGDLALSSELHESDPFAPADVYEALWLNIYGPALVQRIGGDRMRSTPAASIVDLRNGGVLWLTHPSLDVTSDEARRAQAKALAHLRDDVTFDDAFKRLMARSERLAPVERDWDRDIEDLLRRVVDSGSFEDRQLHTARLNQYRPDVTEWRPLEDLQPSDVDVADDTVQSYREHAERLAALLREDVPSVMEGSPESLPLIDYYFWHTDYPGTFPREDIESDLVPAIGAYLGELLIRNLGGRWVPRKHLDESQVIVKNRVWLPFLRARRYMGTRQSTLDHSLTKFYRVASRLRGSQ